MLSIYLDDIRDPKTNRNWIVLRTSQEAIDYVKANGLPQYCSFDHDLGGEDTAMVFLKWLIDFDLDNDGQIIPENFQYNVHSANNVGLKNIQGLLDSYLAFRK